MPQPPAGQDYYMVVGLSPNASSSRSDLAALPSGVWASMLTYIVAAYTEEEAIEKVAPIMPDATLFIAQVVPTFPRP